jgi:PleD family two-component response regulator
MSILREETGLSQMHTAEVIVTNRRDKHMNEQFVNEPNEKPRILIVDNNSQFARSARLLLDQSGQYVACTVIDPRRALETARSFKPDLVLVDLIMPQLDGPEIAAQIESDWALHGVPIFSSLLS